MNTLRFSTSLSSTPAAFTRAQFSPLSRGNSAPSKTSTAMTAHAPFRVAQTPAFPPLWSAKILDWLQPMLTRYHD